MKEFKNIAIAILLVFAGFTASAQKKVETVQIKTNIACDHCAICGTCQPLIETTLIAEKGVKTAKLDVASQVVTVVYKTTKTNPDILRESLSNAGYDADGTKAKETGVAQLDECCIKVN
ncbi:MAG: cation transporter [Fimbriimonadaceae bacterium]|nr:cation transporter [Chitinophagales bacterium]